MNHNILHICSINTNGLQQSEKRQRLIEWSYAPNNMNKRNTFFKQVDRFINEYSIGQIILAGDYK